MRSRPSNKVQSIAESLAFGDAALSEAGLRSYLKSVQHDYECDLEMARTTRESKTRVLAAKLALKLCGFED